MGILNFLKNKYENNELKEGAIGDVQVDEVGENNENDELYITKIATNNLSNDIALMYVKTSDGVSHKLKFSISASGKNIVCKNEGGKVQSIPGLGRNNDSDTKITKIEFMENESGQPILSIDTNKGPSDEITFCPEAADWGVKFEDGYFKEIRWEDNDWNTGKIEYLGNSKMVDESLNEKQEEFPKINNLICSCQGCGSDNLTLLDIKRDSQNNVTQLNYRCNECDGMMVVDLDIDFYESSFADSFIINDDNDSPEFTRVEEDIDITSEDVLKYARDNFNYDNIADDGAQNEALNDARKALKRERIQNILDKQCKRISDEYNCNVYINFNSTKEWRIQVDAISSYKTLKKIINDGQSCENDVLAVIAYYLDPLLEDGSLKSSQFKGVNVKSYKSEPIED